MIFLDDILIYSSTLEDHLDNLQLVFAILNQHNLFLKQSKFLFPRQTLEYFGHIIGAHGVTTNPQKIKAVVDWPTPKDAKQLRGFLGLSGYYRKFIKTMESIFCRAPILVLPEFTKSFNAETDASSIGIGAVLSENNHPMAYISKALWPKEQALSTYKKMNAW